MSKRKEYKLLCASREGDNLMCWGKEAGGLTMTLLATLDVGKFLASSSEERRKIDNSFCDFAGLDADEELTMLMACVPKQYQAAVALLTQASINEFTGAEMLAGEAYKELEVMAGGVVHGVPLAAVAKDLGCEYLLQHLV